MPRYLVTRDTWILGEFRLAGAELDMSTGTAQPFLDDERVIDAPPVVRVAVPLRYRQGVGAWQTLPPLFLRLAPGVYDLEIDGHVVTITIVDPQHDRTASLSALDAADTWIGSATRTIPGRTATGIIVDVPDTVSGLAVRA